MTRGLLVLALLLAASPAPARAPFHPKKVDIIAPTPRPRRAADAPPPAPEPPMDLSHALPGASLAHLPSSARQLQSLSSQLATAKPKLDEARRKSDALAGQAAALKQKLIATAARIEDLERTQNDDALEIARLEVQDRRMSEGFARDRVSVTRLVAVLERLQHDMPPALAMRPDDALGAARGAMLVGASLPPLYARAAALSRRLDALRRTRAELARQRADALATAAALGKARTELDGLVDVKQREAGLAADDYGTLKNQLESVARQAAGFQALLARIAQLRRTGADQPQAAIVTVQAQNAGAFAGVGALLPPVVGTFLASTDAAAPGVTFVTRPLAQAIAPADGKVLYAGPYHKSGQVLILEISTGYDLVLAGLGRVDVRPNDELLAGEPVGNMPSEGAGDERLYFELRHGGHGISPAPFITLELRKAKRT